MAMRISRNYTVDDWKALKFKDETDRYDPPRENQRVCGPSLDCALIETMQQFREGAQKTRDVAGRVPGAGWKGAKTTSTFWA
jgi:hypothetical protein